MIDKNEVLKLAGLAKLEFSEQELGTVINDMSEIIDFANTVNSAEVSLKESGAPASLDALRSDTVKASRSREEILKNAKSENGMFTVKGGI